MFRLIAMRNDVVTLIRALPIVMLAAVFFVMAAAPAAQASISNRLYLVDIRPKHDYTHITVKTKNQPDYKLVTLPGNRLRLTLRDTTGPLFRKFRRYSDTNIGGLVFSRRGGNLLITLSVAPGTGWRELSIDGTNAITLDVGKPFNPGPPRLLMPGREKIWDGVEKLVRDFEPPLKTDIPFQPTDRMILKNFLNEGDQQAFMVAEAALYKGRLSEAEEIFSQFAARQTPIRSLALYRLGETYYKLQQYPQALAAFREAERLWAAYLNFNPGITFYYGDSIARSGDLQTGRTLLANLIARLADKNYAPSLLVRLGDVLYRQGHDQEAVAIYRTVENNFCNDKAGLMARLRLADREFLRATPWNYTALGTVYSDISQEAEDFTIREEAYFKEVLLESINGGAVEALRHVVLFQKKFPRGVYATVCRSMREVLAAQVYRQTDWHENADGLIRFVEEQQDYLAGCLDQEDFLPKVVKAYDEASRPIELIKLFSTLLERQWAAANQPFLYEELADKADLLGDTAFAEKNLRAFLRRFPSHPHARLVMERLGWIYFSGQKYQDVKDTLLWLLNKKERAQRPESYYYLGRALWELKGYAEAARAMDLFVAAAPDSPGSRELLPDAYYVSASARALSGDRKGALKVLEAGIKRLANNGTDELVYKAGEINLLDGRKQLARGYFEQVIKNGKDAEWRRMAQQALDTM